METLFLKQASTFLQDKYKVAASKLTFNVISNAQRWTEEVTDCNPWVPDARVMAQIARASYNLHDYWRIVNVLHKRLSNIDWKKWRIAYNSLILLDFLLTHGPEEFAHEFQCDCAIIQELAAFEYKDAKGFNWGVYMKNKSERVLQLLKRGQDLEEARSNAIKLMNKIQGFGSSSVSTPSSPSSSKWIPLSFRWRPNPSCLSSDKLKDFRYERVINTPTSEDLSQLLTRCNGYTDLIDEDDTEVTLFDLIGLGDVNDEGAITSELCLEIHVNHVGYRE